MSYEIKGERGDWEAVVGLEVHAQIISNAKLFSGAATQFGAAPNTQVSLVDAAMPGMLPVLNGHCVAQAVRTGLGLKAKINKRSVFERKNYFYPDLPPGYQISQYAQPIVGEGEVLLDMPDGSTRAVGIERLHMEQDAGKSLHDQDPNRTFIDLNRAGVALMEIVSKPDIRSPEEAGLYLRKLRSILRYLGTCDGNMEEGSMRADVNVSVRPKGSNELRTRAEVKNVNSVRFVMQAIEAEAARQVAIYDAGGEVKQETRLYDSDEGVTRPMRIKEFAHDYRYFPDPDLLPLTLTDEFIRGIAAALPELPDAKKARFIRDYQLTPDKAAILVADREVADAFEEVCEADFKRRIGDDSFLKIVPVIRDHKREVDLKDYPQFPVVEFETSASSTANLIISDVFAYAKESEEELPKLIRRLDLSGLQKLRDEEVISGRIAKEVLLEMMQNPGLDAETIVEAKGLKQISDASAIEAAVDKVIAANSKQVADVRAGKEKTIGWLVGQVMKATQGKANPQMVNELLKRKLGG